MEMLNRDTFREIALYISNVDKLMVALVSKSCFVLASPATAGFDELLLDRRGYSVLVGRYTIAEQLAKYANIEQKAEPQSIAAQILSIVAVLAAELALKVAK